MAFDEMLKRDDVPEDLKTAIRQYLSETREYETELKESEHRYEQMFENNPAIKLLIDPSDGRILKANQTAVHFYGYDSETLHRMRIMDINTLPDEQIKNEMDNAVRQRCRYFNFRHRLASGEVRDVEAYSGPVHSAGKTLLFTIIHDITERKQAEAALQRSEYKFRTIFDFFPQAIVLSEPNTGCLVDCNRVFCELVGIEKPEILGRTLTDLAFLTLEDYMRFKDSMQAFNEVRGMETVFMTESHKEKHALIFGRFIQWEADAHILILFLDITEQKRLESMLQHTAKMEAVGTLAGGVSHEFNNILGIILANTEMAMDDIGQKHSAMELLEESRDASLRGRDVVRQLLSFSRKSVAEHKTIEIQAIIKESIKLLRASIPSHIEIRSYIRSTVGQVNADATQIYQLMVNLCSNAAQAMNDKGGAIMIRLDEISVDQSMPVYNGQIQPGRYAALSISDTGSGIAPSVQDRIFDPYFTTRKYSGGNGLGLSVVFGIVKAHEGGIRFESEVGAGTTVEVFLPITREIKMPEKQAPPRPLTGGTERILLVDDEAALVKTYGRFLEKLGYSVTLYTDPTAALSAFSERPTAYDLIITDLAMPGIRGDHLAARILSVQAKIKIILCSGYTEQIGQLKPADIGVHAILRKPLNQSEMAAAVRRVLDKEG